MLVAGSIRGGGQQGEDDEGTWYAGHGRPFGDFSSKITK